MFRSFKPRVDGLETRSCPSSFGTQISLPTPSSFADASQLRLNDPPTADLTGDVIRMAGDGEGIPLIRDIHDGNGIPLIRDIHDGEGIPLIRDIHDGDGIPLIRDIHDGDGIPLIRDTHDGEGILLIRDIYDGEGRTIRMAGDGMPAGEANGLIGLLHHGDEAGLLPANPAR